MLDVTRARAKLKRDEGRAAGLRIAIEAYCEAVGIALDETQRLDRERERRRARRETHIAARLA